MFNFESPINMSVGNIESVRINKKGRVKYEIAYLDNKGKEHKAWSNWMQDNGASAGDGIPVQTMTMPGTFGLCSYLMEVSGVRQQHTWPYVVAMVAIAVGMTVVGYMIGKDKE